MKLQEKTKNVALVTLLMCLSYHGDIFFLQFLSSLICNCLKFLYNFLKKLFLLYKNVLFFFKMTGPL